MAATPIVINYGETVHRVFLITGIDFDTETDVILFVIRDKAEKPLIWKVLTPYYDDEVQNWCCDLDITHAESERYLPKGSYKYGLTFYHNVEYTDGYPSDGEVIVHIARKAFKVKESVAREEGLY